MFQFLAFVKMDSEIRSLYFVIGFSDERSGAVFFAPRLFSIKAPIKALVAGGYIIANFMNKSCSLLLNFLITAINLLQELSIVVSGIIFIFLTASNNLSNGIVSFVILFFCLMKAIL